MKNHHQEGDLETAAAGGSVSRRWLLKSTAKFTAGTVALATFGVGLGAAAAKPALDGPGSDPVPGKVESAVAAFDFDGGV